MSLIDGETPWYESVFDRVSTGLDYVIDDWIGGWSGSDTSTPVYGLGGAPYYPEQTPPVSNATPQSVDVFQIGNNAPTYALGFGALVVLFLVYKAVK